MEEKHITNVSVLSMEEVAEKFPLKQEGLNDKTVRKKREEFGKNEFIKEKKKPLWKKILIHLMDFTTIILLVAAGISFYTVNSAGHGSYLETLLILAIVFINVFLSLYQEGKAEKSLEALSSLNQDEVLVLRNGKREKIYSVNVVPGDIIILHSGDKILADGRLIEAVQLKVEEASLTGEGEAVEKDATFISSEELPLGDRKNMVYSGTSVVSGRGKYLVTATGMKTEMGEIAQSLLKTRNPFTPLQKRLSTLGKRLTMIALSAGVFVFLLGWLQNEPILDMFLNSVSLAVAAVPETLMVIVTLTMAFGVQQMAQKNAIIRKLPAVETLGTTNVILSDKTGTLTMNQMTVRKIWTTEEKISEDVLTISKKEEKLLTLASLNSDVVIEKKKEVLKFKGNPTEKAIVKSLTDNHLSYEDIQEKYPRVKEIPFDSKRKMMTTLHKFEDNYLLIVKGAFDVLSPKFIDPHEGKKVNEKLGKEGLRVIALGYRILDELPENLFRVENNLHFVGLLGLSDPPRPESKFAIKKAEKAGIETVMITGDHQVTAKAIAQELGILKSGKKVVSGSELREMSDETLLDKVKDIAVYARVTPNDKLRIVNAWQEKGVVVAMTGDGVNDAPALKAADVGLAMGITGTPVARSAADIILTDDNFATIVDAVAKGRGVYQNILKTVNFLLSCNISEVFIVILAMLFGWGAPFTALQLLFVNVIADGLPGFALAKEPTEDKVMEKGPIAKKTSIFGHGLGKNIFRNALLFTVVTLVGYYLGSFILPSFSASLSHHIGQTMAFLILAYSSIFHIFTVRSHKLIIKSSFKENVTLFQMAILSILLVTLVALLPVTQNILSLVNISLVHWGIVFLLSLLPLLVNEWIKYIHLKK